MVRDLELDGIQLVEEGYVEAELLSQMGGGVVTGLARAVWEMTKATAMVERVGFIVCFGWKGGMWVASE